MTTAAVYLAWVALGVLIAFPVGLAVGWISRDREQQPGCPRCAESAAIATEAVAALERIQADLDTGDRLAEAADFEAWSRELREDA